MEKDKVKRLLSTKKSTKIELNEISQMKLNLRSAITASPSNTSLRSAAEDIVSARRASLNPTTPRMPLSPRQGGVSTLNAPQTPRITLTAPGTEPEPASPKPSQEPEPESQTDKDSDIPLESADSKLNIKSVPSNPDTVLLSSRPFSTSDLPKGLIGNSNFINDILGTAEQLEKNFDTDDPFVERISAFSLPKKYWVVLLFIPLTSWLLLLPCYGIDRLDEAPTGLHPHIADLMVSTFFPSVDTGRSVLEVILGSMSVLFGMLITVIGIIVQLAAGRFTSHITTLFFRDKWIIFALGWVVLCNTFGFWVYESISVSFIPRAAVILAVLMNISFFVLLFPFLGYLFYFLDPKKVVMKIMMNGLQAAADSINDKGAHVDRHQVKATLAIEHLVDAASSALKKRDKNITADIVDALCSFAMTYGNYKDDMGMEWYQIPAWIRQSPDFLALSEEYLEDLTKRRCWLEWKILRQYQSLFDESLKLLKELSYHIAMNTRIMGEAAARRGDYHSLDLCLKFFNTYLRTSINGKEVRVIYNILFQYRMLGEYLVRYGKESGPSATAPNEVEVRAIRVAKFMRYYSSILLVQNFAFLVEVISHDIRVMCEAAFQEKSIAHNALLEIFLTLEDSTDGKSSNPGVRKAKVILATSYMLGGGDDYARKIQEEFNEESHKVLWSLLHELKSLTNREFWEVTERGYNFLWLTPQQKAQLPRLFSWCKNFTSEHDVPLNPAEKRKFLIQQQLFNFDPKA